MKKDKLLQMFVQAAEKGSLSHAYILEGRKEDGGKELLARQIAGKLTPYHEDITFIESDGRTVKDEAVFGLQERLSLKPMVGDLNIGIIKDADTMTLRAQNRLLKTLEEPLGGALIILLSENRLHLLPTILSRCVVRRVDEEGEENGGGDFLEQVALAGQMLLEHKGLSHFLRMLEPVIKEREEVFSFLEDLEQWFHDVLVYQTAPERALLWQRDERMPRWSSSLDVQRGYRAIRLLEEGKNDILRNVNPGYTIKNLILKI